MAILTHGNSGRQREFGLLEGDSEVWTLAVMLLRYGPLTFYRLRSQGQALIDAFNQIYAAQDEGTSFRSPKELLGAVGMQGWAERNCSDGLSEVLGENDTLAATELVAAFMRNTYNQDWATANTLVCMTAVAPLTAGGSSAAWSVQGGNHQIVKALLNSSQANVRLGRTVEAIHPSDDEGGYRLRHCSSAAQTRDDIQEETFDHVIIAAPLVGSGIEGIPDAGEHQAVARMPFQKVHTTVVSGTLSPSYFGMKAQDSELLNSLTDVLTTASGATPFSSIGHYSNKDNVTRWKFFSQERLTGAHLSDIFTVHDEASVVRHLWNSPGAYPLSRPAHSRRSSSFVLHERPGPRGGMVLHPSALEVGTSAMEVLAISARNAALLLANKEELLGVSQSPQRMPKEGL